MLAELTHPGRTSARDQLLNLVRRFDEASGELATAESAAGTARVEYAEAGSEFQKYQIMQNNAYRDGWLPEWREQSRPAELAFESARKIALAAAADLTLARNNHQAARVELGRALWARKVRLLALPDGRCAIDLSHRPPTVLSFRADGSPAGPPPPDHDAEVARPVNLDSLT